MTAHFLTGVLLQAAQHRALQLEWKAWQSWLGFAHAQALARHKLEAADDCWRNATQRAVCVHWQLWQQVWASCCCS